MAQTMTVLARILPFTDWFRPKYGLGSAKADIVSGLTVALVLIPQSMAYAQLAGLPSYYGLYAAFLPPMIAALFGSSRQLATGPVAVVSLMTSASLGSLATAGSQSYIAYAILLALMVGIFQLSLGLLRLGLVVNFLSHPVVNGFTNAAALIIATSQLSKLFGVSVDSAAHHYETILRVCRAAAHYTHWPTLIMGSVAFAIMFGLRKLNPKIPNVLVAVVITTLASWAIGFEKNRTIPIGRIRSEATRTLIERFNRATVAASAMAANRANITARLEQARKAHDEAGSLWARHEMEVLNFKIARLDRQIGLDRERLRGALLVAVKKPGEGVVFFPKAEAPAGTSPDPTIWRIKVGNRPLDSGALLMMGGGAVVGHIPRGLPSPGMPAIRMDILFRMLPFAAIISLLGFMEAISIAKAIAAKTGQRIDPNQELIGQGLANILGAVAKSYPTSGSFSRSAVNFQSGAITGLSSVFTSLTVVVVLLFMTPLLYYLPQAVLAAVIMMAVVGLINFSGFVHAWKAQWYDGAISIITFASTLAFAPHLDKGIIVGVVLSLLVFLYKSMRPTVSSLSRHADEALRCAATHGLEECEYVSLVRFESPLFFANASYLEDQINNLMRTRKKLQQLIIVSNGINDMDASGEEALWLIIENVRAAGVDISLSGVNEAVWRVLERTHLAEKIGRDHIYPTMEKAIVGVHRRVHFEEQPHVCPLVSLFRAA